MIKSEKFLSNLGLARRAQVLLSGDMLLKKMSQVKLLIVACDASDKTKERFYKKAHFYNLDVIDTYTSEEISLATGLRNRMALGITDENFKKMLLNM